MHETVLILVINMYLYSKKLENQLEYYLNVFKLLLYKIITIYFYILIKFPIFFNAFIFESR